MNISQAAKISGLSAKTIRYYERIGLVSPAERAENGYRSYQQRHVEQFTFLHRARTTGFSLEECRQLLSLYADRNRHSAEVKALVLEKAEHVDKQIQALQAMRETLLSLASRCSGDEQPHCAIIDELADSSVDGKGKFL